MTPVSLDPELVQKLTANGGQVPLTDASGNAIGFFLTTERFEVMEKALYDQAFAEMSDEEARRVLANPKRHTMEEVLKLLEEK
jgi:hypothetical protein